MAIVSGEDSAPLLTNSTDLRRLKDRTGFPSCRLILSIMGFLGFVNVYALRVNLSVAMVAMVKSSDRAKNTSVEETCPIPANISNGSSTHSGEFDWDPNIQGLVLGSFFYGYILTQIPGGYLAERFGGKWLYGLGVLCTAVFTLVTPIAARASVYLLIAVRVIEGIGEGVTFPAMCAMLAKWAPPYERSKLGTFIYSGAQFGTVISMPISGILCQYGPAGGWPSVFYIFGGFGCLWFVFWVFLVYSSPADHPRISEQERTYIEGSIGEGGEKLPVPWRAIFTSMNFWAILFAHFSFNWGFYTLLTCMPTFLSEVLHFDMSQNGFASAIPYLAMGIVMGTFGWFVDKLRSRHILSTTKVRKLANLIGLATPAVTLAFIGYAGCDAVLIIAFLTVAVGFAGAAQSGYGVNHLDLAPPFAGTMLGLTNAAATIPGFLGPQVVGLLTSKHVTRLRWQVVFWISSAVFTFGLIFYLIFGSGEEQKWAKPEYAEIQRMKNKSRKRNDGSEGDLLVST